VPGDGGLQIGDKLLGRQAMSLAIDAAGAVELTDPPNADRPLAQFLVPDPGGGPTPLFDSGAWAQAAEADPSWAAAYGGCAYWGTASWGTAYWGTAASADAYWGSSSLSDNAADDKLAGSG